MRCEIAKRQTRPLPPSVPPSVAKLGHEGSSLASDSAQSSTAGGVRGWYIRWTMASGACACTVDAMGPGRGLSRSQWYDVGLAAGALAISISVLMTISSWEPGPVAVLLVLAHVLPVAFRRRMPRAAFAVSVGAGVIYLAAGWPMVGLGVAALVMIYSLAAYSERVWSLLGLAAIELGLTPSKPCSARVALRSTRSWAT